jgi:hypothetical protein
MHNGTKKAIELGYILIDKDGRFKLTDEGRQVVERLRTQEAKANQYKTVFDNAEKPKFLN